MEYLESNNVQFIFRSVRILRLLGQDTIEEGMYEIAQEKLNLEQQLTGSEGMLKLMNILSY